MNRPMDDAQKCPVAIAAFLRERLTPPQKRYPPLVRLLRRSFVYESYVPDLKRADARRFAHADPARRTVYGELLGRWHLDRNSAERPLPEPPPFIPMPEFCVHERFLPALVANFAVTSAGNSCVIELIDMDGRTERAEYQLPNGIDGPALGPMIGKPQIFRRHRGDRDLCMPNGWVPRATAHVRRKGGHPVIPP